MTERFHETNLHGVLGCQLPTLFMAGRDGKVKGAEIAEFPDRNAQELRVFRCKRSGERKIRKNRDFFTYYMCFKLNNL